MKLSQLALSYGFAGPAYDRDHLLPPQDRHVLPGGVLNPTVRVVALALATASVLQSPIPRHQSQVGWPTCDPPTHHFARESVQHQRQVNELGLQPDVGDIIRDPELIFGCYNACAEPGSYTPPRTPSTCGADHAGGQSTGGASPSGS